MKLVIVHFHLRPGGVRRVIEEGTRNLVANGAMNISSIVLVSGEPSDAAWRKNFQSAVSPVPVRHLINPAFGYITEQRITPSRIAREIHSAMKKLSLEDGDKESVVWFHNSGLGRNLLLVRELERVCDERNIPIIAHHHDWWFDSRWQRWPDFIRCGFRTPAAVAKTIFSTSPRTGHAAINSTDAEILAANCRAPVAWLPNPVTISAPVPAARIREARAWLREQLATDAPVWILPCRMLRRKNMAEALLLTRWLRPDAMLVTTGGVSSEDERPYFEKLEAAARRNKWPLWLALMRGDESKKPSVPALIAASEVVMLTSIQEGFGLPFIEAAASRRPLIARRLPNISPDLAQFGFRFPYAYDEILIHPDLFDRPDEITRQKKILAGLKNEIPQSCRRFVGHLQLLATDAAMPVPFSRLTLTAQLEILAQPVERSWILGAPLNPFLARWQHDAAAKKLRVTPWPRSAEKWLGAKAYAQRFADLLAAAKNHREKHPRDFQAQEAFIRQRLDSQHLFPLLLRSDT